MIYVRLTEEEKAAVSQKMESAGFANLSGFARSMLVNGTVTKVDFSELKPLIRELGNLNRNLNQIAKVAWTTHDLHEQDYQDVLQDWLEAKDLIDRYLYRVIHTGGKAYQNRSNVHGSHQNQGS